MSAAQQSSQPSSAHLPGPRGRVCVRFWASARAAAGVPEVEVEVSGPVTLDELVGLLVAGLDAARPGLERVLGICSVLVGDRPAGAADRTAVVVRPGQTVEFLPPFAGG